MRTCLHRLEAESMPPVNLQVLSHRQSCCCGAIRDAIFSVCRMKAGTTRMGMYDRVVSMWKRARLTHIVGQGGVDCRASLEGYRPDL